MTRLRQPGEHRLLAIHRGAQRQQRLGQRDPGELRRIDVNQLVDRTVQPIRDVERRQVLGLNH